MRTVELGITLLTLGFVLIFIGTVLVAVAGLMGAAETSGAVTVLIGPIPIAVSWGPWGMELLLISLVMVAIMLLAIYLFFWQAKRLAEGGEGVGPALQ